MLAIAVILLMCFRFLNIVFSLVTSNTHTFHGEVIATLLFFWIGLQDRKNTLHKFTHADVFIMIVNNP